MRLLDVLDKIENLPAAEPWMKWIAQDSNGKVFIYGDCLLVFNHFEKRWEPSSIVRHIKHIATLDEIADDHDFKVADYSEALHYCMYKRFMRGEDMNKTASKIKIKINDISKKDTILDKAAEIKPKGIIAGETLKEIIDGFTGKSNKIEAGEPLPCATGKIDVSAANPKPQTGDVVDVYGLNGVLAHRGVEIVAQGSQIWIVSINDIEIPIQRNQYVFKVRTPENEAALALHKYSDKPYELLEAIKNGAIPHVRYEANE